MKETIAYQSMQAEKWRLFSVADRAEILIEACSKLADLSGDADKAKGAFGQIFSQVTSLDKVFLLTGSTGESNELYSQSRGKTLVIGTDTATMLPVLVQLISASIAGNQVVLHFPTQANIAEVVDYLDKKGVVSGILDLDNQTDFGDLLNDVRLAQVAIVGHIDEVKALSSIISKTDGILTQVIAITDQENLSEIFTPDYLHRFTTERVRTINTTAIGGNASLLELGVE